MISRYLNIIKSIEISERKIKLNNKKENKNHQLRILAVTITLIVISAFLFVLHEYTGNIFILISSKISIVLSYIILLTMPFIDIYMNRKTICRSFKTPFNSAIDTNIKNESIIDSKRIKSLLKIDISTLQLGLLEIKHEKNFLEKRILIILGSIEKVGLLPGILAILIMVFKTGNQNEWVSIIAYSNIGLMLLSIHFYHLLFRYERMTSLTELAIKLKQETQ